MDLNKVSVFAAMKKQMGWLNQRQRVLSENIANSDSPKFRAKDLKPINFEKALDESTRLKMQKTSGNHLVGTRDYQGDNKILKERKPYETSPDGNSVVLEEQVMKVNKTQIDHRMTNDLYKKHMQIFKIALGKG